MNSTLVEFDLPTDKGFKSCSVVFLYVGKEFFNDVGQKFKESDKAKIQGIE